MTSEYKVLLAELKRLEGLATARPWSFDDSDGSINVDGSVIGLIYTADDFPCLDLNERTVADRQRLIAEFSANQRIVVTLRNNLPLILAALENAEFAERAMGMLRDHRWCNALCSSGHPRPSACDCGGEEIRELLAEWEGRNK